MGVVSKFRQPIPFNHVAFCSSERFLYADLISVPVHGQPLTYTTRYFPPVRKCLKFYYHMHGDGVGYLAVQFLQGFQLKEIFRLVGNQGSGWKSATMPLGVVDSTGPQFKVSSYQYK